MVTAGHLAVNPLLTVVRRALDVDLIINIRPAASHSMASSLTSVFINSNCLHLCSLICDGVVFFFSCLESGLQEEALAREVCDIERYD